MSPENSSFEIINTKTAEEFWEYLSPQNPLFERSNKFLYRGQADDQWPLLPSIIREETSRSFDRQILKELLYLKSFVQYCDSIGLAIPNDSPSFRDKFLDEHSPRGPGGCFIDTSVWPPDEMYPLLALGQHYGLKTRLLDWSKRSFVAAYFAISDALAKKIEVPKHLAVWVLDIEFLYYVPEIAVISVPGGNNANLAAQAGLFTLLKQKGSRYEVFNGATALDLHIRNLENLPIILRKVTLPVSEATKALKLCLLYGVTGATLFPSYYGAARAADDHWRIYYPLLKDYLS